MSFPPWIPDLTHHDSNTNGHETPLSEGGMTHHSTDLSVASDVDDAEPSSSPISPSRSIPPTEPGLPRLTFNSFLPILQQLGSALVDEDGEYLLVGNVDENKMRHLRAYAAKVEELSISIPETPGASNSVYFRLGELRDGNKPLFPALTRLSITVSNEHDLNHLTLLLSPSLKSLSITNISTKARASLRSFLTMLKPNILERIQLDTLELNSTLTSTILQSRNLRCIEFNALQGSLKISDLESILVLPALKYFTVDASSTLGSTLTASSSTSRPSLSLEELHITGPSQLLFDLLRFIGTKATLSNIYCKISSDFRSFDPFLKLIGAHHSQSLHQLTLSLVNPKTTSDLQSHLTAANYDVLKRLTRLEIFVMSDVPFEDINHALRLLTPCWPRMKHLSLSLTGDLRGRRVSLPTLRVIARSCPQLTDLQCPLEMKAPGDLLSSYLLWHGLERLSLRGDSDGCRLPHEKFDVGRYLAALFPCLEEITVLGSTGHAAWKEVYDSVQICQMLFRAVYEIESHFRGFSG